MQVKPRMPCCRHSWMNSMCACRSRSSGDDPAKFSKQKIIMRAQGLQTNQTSSRSFPNFRCRTNLHKSLSYVLEWSDMWKRIYHTWHSAHMLFPYQVTHAAASQIRARSNTCSQSFSNIHGDQPGKRHHALFLEVRWINSCTPILVARCAAQGPKLV